MLDLAQVFAWSRMFAGYARCESIGEAAKETFDPAKPCALCLALCKAREADKGRAPALPSTGSEKLILIFDRQGEFVSQTVRKAWPTIRDNIVSSQVREVPVPPPRGTALNIPA
jgi:hypothetical protein